MRPEDRFVEKLRALLPRDAAVLLGPGDDAAIIARDAGLLAATTDLLVEGVDFLPGEDPERLGRRAAAVNLSDLAAMGARPDFFLLAVGFPAERGQEYPLSIARGAIDRAGQFGARLVGGDLSAAPQTVLSIALWGTPAGPPLRRSGAAPGDLVYVSGHPGEAAAGLHLAKSFAGFARTGAPASPPFPELSAADRTRLLAAFHDPIPPVALGAALGAERLASAAIDVSDGLGVDAGRLARASGVRIVLDEGRLPLSAALAAFAATAGLDPVQLAIAGGDDYALLFTAPETSTARLEAAAASLATVVTRIGRVEPGRGAGLSGPRGSREIEDLGYDHLGAPR